MFDADIYRTFYNLLSIIVFFWSQIQWNQPTHLHPSTSNLSPSTSRRGIYAELREMLIPSIRARKAVETGCDDVEDAIAWSGAPRVALGWFVESAMGDENFNACVFLVLYLSFTWHFGWEISNSDFWWLVAPFPLRLKTILCPNPNPLGSKCTPESQRGWGWNDIRTMMTSMSLLKCSGPERTVSDAKSCFAMKPRCLVSLVFCPCDKLIIRFTKNACELFFQLNNIKSYQSTLH